MPKMWYYDYETKENEVGYLFIRNIIPCLPDGQSQEKAHFLKDNIL